MDNMPESQTPIQPHVLKIGPDGQPEIEVEIAFERSSYFRVIHVDGAFGGPTANDIRMALFSEGPVFPERIRVKASPAGVTEIDRNAPSSVFVRTLEAEAVMNLQSAVAVYNWLGDKIAQLQNIQSIVKAQEVLALPKAEVKKDDTIDESN